MADLIGSWNPTNCVFGLFPENLKLARDNTDQEHRTLSNFNTGDVPLFEGESSPGSLNATLTNMATGYGYNDGKLVFDGVSDHILTNYYVSLTDTNEDTIEFVIDRIDATAYYLGGTYDDNDNYDLFYIGSDNKVWRSIKVGGTLSRTKSTDTISSGIRTISFEKVGATGKIYFDGTEVSAYDYQETYSSGDKTFTNPFMFGYVGISPAYEGDMFSIRYYDDAIGSTRILANYNLGAAMGLTVSDRQLNEMLTVPNIKRSIGTKSQDSGSTASVSADQWEVTISGIDSAWSDGDSLVVDSESLDVYSRTGDTFRLQSKTTKSGSGLSYTIERAYSTIQLWEDDRDGDLATRNTVEKGICYADSDFSSGVTIDGSITDLTRFMWLTVAEGNRHNGTKDGGGVVIDRAGTAGSVIVANDPYTLIEWIRITNINNTFGSNVAIQLGQDYCSAKKCMVHDCQVSGYFTAIAAAITTAYVENCQVFNLTNNSSNVMWGITVAENTQCYNNTVYNLVKASTGDVRGISGNLPAADPKVVNCISMDSDSYDYYQCGTAAGADYNISSDGTAPGAHSIINKSASDQFKDLGSGVEDFNLKPGSDAIDTGYTLSGIFTDDAAGNTRDVPWDMGALLYLEQTITVVAPNGGETWDIDSVQDITWTSENVSGLVTIQKSIDGGSNYTNIKTGEANDGTYPWTVTGPASLQGKIKVFSENAPLIFDESDVNFEVAALASIAYTNHKTGLGIGIGI